MQEIIYCEPGMVADTDYVSGTHAVVCGYGGGGGGGEPNSINTITVAEQITDVQAIIAQYLIDNPVTATGPTIEQLISVVDPAVVEAIFHAGLLLFVVGLGAGWAVHIIKQAR